MEFDDIEQRVLILTPKGRDAILAAENLMSEGLHTKICASSEDFMDNLTEGAAAGIIAEEAISVQSLEHLTAWLQNQPPWSDFPFILGASGEQSTMRNEARYRLFEKLGNLTILERPFHRETLLISVRSALRNRRRQYQARSYLLEREQVADELEARVAQRTQALLETREALHQAQKLEAIGRLAGGIAHDFNNIMTGIQGISEDLSSQLSPGEPMKADLEEIVKASARAGALTKQLLAFGRKQVIAPKVLDVNQMVIDMKPLFLRLLREDIELDLILQPGVGNIWIDGSNFEQILINLVMNARDALPNGGSIRIETRSVQPEGDGPSHVVLNIKDTGAGMSPDIIDHIFEPFFTTKGLGKGTGLGLATVYGHVKQSNGDILATSGLNEGTTMRITWPTVNLPAEIVKSGLMDVPQGRETILVVEDEDIVRNVVVRALQRQGYGVLQASSGSKALKLSSDFMTQIDLLLVDVVMPEMDGRQVAQTMTSTHKEMLVLYMSGHTDEVIMHKGILDKGIDFIEKPFTADALCRKVREILDQHHMQQRSAAP